MSQKEQDKSSGSVKEAGFAAAIALPLSLLGGWAAYGVFRKRRVGPSPRR